MASSSWFQQQVGKQPTGQVVVIEIVLCVDAMHRAVGQDGARYKRIESIVEQVVSRFAGMGIQFSLEALIDNGLGRGWISPGLDTLEVRGQGGATGQAQNYGEESKSCNHLRSFKQSLTRP